MGDWNFKFVESLAKEMGSKLNDGLKDARKNMEDLATQSKPKLEQALSAVKESAQTVKEKASSSVENIHKLSLNAIDLDKLQQQVSSSSSSTSSQTQTILADSDTTRASAGDKSYSDTINKLLQAYDSATSSSSPSSSVTTTITPRLLISALPSDLASFASGLNERYGEKYIVYNLSEKKYDSGAFQGTVVEYSFPGHSSPPLGLLFELCLSIESWLAADKENVVLIHCLTGKGRTAVLTACLLSWLEDLHCQVGEDGSKGLGLDPMPTPKDALAFVCRKIGSPVARCTLPSQRLYVSYFANVLEGVRPRLEPIKLEKVVVNVDQAKMRMPMPEGAAPGSRPYIQLFKNGKLLFSSIWADAKTDEGTKVVSEEQRVDFPIDCRLDGDILLRCRHVDTSNEGKPTSRSVFRCAFHTGFIPLGPWRLTKKELDGVNCCEDEGFAVELVFAEAGPPPSDENEPEEAKNYDALIHAKSSFWEEISKRKARKREFRKSEGNRKGSTSPASPPPSFSILGDEEDGLTGKDGGHQQSAADFGLEGSESWRDELEALSFSEAKAKSASVDAKAEETAEDLALLEQELGLENTAGQSGAATPTTDLMNDAKGEEVTNASTMEETGETGKETAPKPTAAEDDLAELEDYLNSVNET